MFLGVLPLGIGQQQLNELIEHFWYISNHNIDGALLLERLNTVDNGAAIIAEIHHTQMVGGDWGVADILYFYKTRFIYDNSFGQLVEETTLYKELEGRMMLPNWDSGGSSGGTVPCGKDCG